MFNDYHITNKLNIFVCFWVVYKYNCVQRTLLDDFFYILSRKLKNKFDRIKHIILLV